MSKTLKDMMTQELQRDYEGVDYACVVDLTGLDAGATYGLRGLLRDRHMSMHVVKNRIARRAFVGGPLEMLGRELDGPCALVTGGENAIEIARELSEAARKYPKLQLKFGLLEGEDELTPLADLASMKSLDELRSDIAGLVLSPGRNLAGAICSGGGNIAACIKTLIEKLEKGETVETPDA